MSAAELVEFCRAAIENENYDPDALDRLAETALAREPDNVRLSAALSAHGWNAMTRVFNIDPDLRSLYTALSDTAATRPKFIGIKFCRECNNMLYAKENVNQQKLQYECRNCGYIESTNEHCVSIERMIHDVDTLTQVNADVATDPTLPHTRGNRPIKCEKCGYDDAVCFQAQSNRDKTGMRLYYVCCRPGCGYKWCD